MDFKERLALTQQKMDELNKKISEAADTAKKAHQMKKEELKADIEQLDREIDMLDKAVDKQIDEDIEKANEFLDKTEKSVAEEIDTEADIMQGDLNAAKENFRLVKERGQSKLNSALLKMQMSINAAKAKLNEKKTERDKAKQEQHIADLLVYAESCQQMALAMALEAELTILEATAEAEDYVEKYGE
ncbi:MAG: hypothetical protein IJR55_06000 [Clostridia bacterium]|nr:hypothetical protein [Clostridia bacterium]